MEENTNTPDTNTQNTGDAAESSTLLGKNMDSSTDAAPQNQTGTPDTGNAAGEFKLPEEYANDPAFAAFKDLSSLCKSYKETKSLVGRKEQNAAGLPDNATPEQVAEFYGKLGAKPDAKGYSDLNFSDQMPQEYRNDAILNKYREAFARNHVPASMAKGLLADVEKDVIAMAAANTQQRAEWEQQELAKLKSDWGENWQENLNKAAAAWQKLRPGWDIKTHALGDNVDVIRLFADLYPLVCSGSVELGSDSKESSIASLQNQIKEIQANKDYWTPGPIQEDLKGQMAVLQGKLSALKRS